MNHLRLGQCLGAVSSESFRRSHQESLIDSLAHHKTIAFAYGPHRRAESQQGTAAGLADSDATSSPSLAHQAGVNCLAIDNNDGRFLVSGGADSSTRLWDLEEFSDSQTTSKETISRTYTPKASLTRGNPSSHTHALTSISIYPFDPTPSTLLTTSYDKSLKVTSITPSSLVPMHTFPLDFLPYTHSLSAVGDASPLIAVGTAHPSIRLLDLRSGLSTHSLSGPNGAVYAVSWSPRTSYILASGSTDGRVLFYDIRRANAVFASLDSDDAAGVVGETAATGLGARPELLDFNSRAHSGPVTSVQWTPGADKIVTAGHDQRIRVWDAATGRNDLVHFGPRLRNERQGELRPLISPRGMHMAGRESLFWPNDDGRGLIFQHHLREGQLLRILRTEGVKAVDGRAQSSKRGRGGRAVVGIPRGDIGRLTSGGRINAMVWRVNAPAGDGVEMYTAHGDGRICAWMPGGRSNDDEEDEDGTDVEEIRLGNGGIPDEAELRRKRKRDLIEDLVGGLTRQPITFS